MTLFYLSSIPNLRVSENNFADEIIRSCAHLGFYFLGYWLFYRAINEAKRPASFILPFFLTCLYGLLDEIHQHFVPTRTFQIKDLLVNFTGSGLGSLFIFIKRPKKSGKIPVDKLGRV